MVIVTNIDIDDSWVVKGACGGILTKLRAFVESYCHPARISLEITRNFMAIEGACLNAVGLCQTFAGLA